MRSSSKESSKTTNKKDVILSKSELKRLILMEGRNSKHNQSKTSISDLRVWSK